MRIARCVLPVVALSLLFLSAEALKKSSSSGEPEAPPVSPDDQHKPFLPLDRRDYATIVLSMLGLIVAAGGGIGGGGILVPIFILLTGFDPKHAIPLSNITILGGSIANTLAGVLSRHPRVDRPLLDWNLILMMEPTTIVGAVIGSFANKLLPGLVISILLVIVLGLLAHRTLSKGIAKFRQEGGFSVGKAPALLASREPSANYSSVPPTLGMMRREKSKLYEDVDGLPAELASTRPPDEDLMTGLVRQLSRVGSASRATPTDPFGLEGGGGQDRAEAAAIVERERHTSLWQPALLTLCFLGIIALEVAKGGEGTSLLGIRCGSLLYWVVTLAVLPWVAIFFLIIRAHLLHDFEHKEAVGYQFQPDDILWTPSTTVKYPLLCVSAGLFAGIFGVGGGIVKGPLMLEMGVATPVAAASAATMILYTSAAATVAFYVFGLIPLDYGAFFFVWGFICTAAGQTLVNRMLHKYKKESFIILSIGVVIFLSAILMAYESVRNFMADPQSSLRSGTLCGH